MEVFQKLASHHDWTDPGALIMGQPYCARHTTFQIFGYPGWPCSALWPPVAAGLWLVLTCLAGPQKPPKEAGGK